MFLFWLLAHIFHIGFFIAALRQPVPPLADRRLATAFLAAATTLLPILSLIVFFRVFIVGGSSNVAQFASEDGYRLWSLWFSAFQPLLLINALAALVCFITICLPPYPRTHSYSFASRICAFLTALFALFTIISLFPTA